MEETLKQIKVDEIILKILNALFLKENSNNLEIYRKKFKTKDEAMSYLIFIDEIRKAKTKVIWSKKGNE